MSCVAVSFVQAIAQAAGLMLREDGIVVAGGRVVRSLTVTDGRHVPEVEYAAFVEWLGRREASQAGLVAAVTRRLRSNDLGVLGLAMKTAPTLHVSLEKLTRYSPLLAGAMDIQLQVTPGRTSLVIDSGRGGPRPSGIRSECMVAAIVRTIRCIAGVGHHVEAVCFRHGCAGDAEHYAVLFECPVLFDGDCDEIVLKTSALDAPNRLGDRALCDFFTERLDEELGASKSGESVKSQLLGHLAGALETGLPRAAEIAKALGMSERTMYRRLASEGWTYRDVLHEAQTALARDLLAGSDCSIAEIAFRTGFSEQSTFSRAFKRRVGHTPAQYRRQDVHA